MAFKVLLDVNILLDFVLQREEYERAYTLIEWATIGRIQAFIAASTLHTAIYPIEKEFGSGQTKNILLTLISDIRVIDIGQDITVSALHSPISNIQHALQYYTALHHRLDYVITRNRDLIQSAIPILPACTPEEFIKSNS
ncbi:MAG TPA: PIN domain-containing protein [Puia sp.]|uniref:type II toxin-antitoxin system VapC family toxin n=1 Tax=Puia sp. TaxID=2045100 RepID=UPI002C3ED20E|nr:PIN domain-containing protein [Puia sp.]HVU98540.1 PIN domain-containing protein [Puia sp.]